MGDMGYSVDDTYYAEATKATKEYFCKTCKKKRPHHVVNVHEAQITELYCGVCGVQNLDDVDEEDSQSAAPDDSKTKADMDKAKGMVQSYDGLRHYLMEKAYSDTKINDLAKDFKGKKLKSAQKQKFYRLQFELLKNQQRWQKNLTVHAGKFMDVIKLVENERSLWVETIDIWEKTLKFNLHKKSVLANILASYCMALKLRKSEYSIDEVLQKTDELNSKTKITRYSLYNDVREAYRIIFERLFTKPICCNTKDESYTKKEIVQGKEICAADYIRCPRITEFAPIHNTTEEKISSIVKELSSNEGLEIDLVTTLNEANKIYKLAESKALTLSQKSKTVSSAIVYLGIRKNNENFLLLDILKISDATDSAVRTLCKSINDALKLGIKL